MNLTIKIDFPDSQLGVQFRTPFDGEALHIERVLRRNGLSYERCLELVGEVEAFLVALGKRFEVSEVEAKQATESEIHAVTVAEAGRLRAMAIVKREEEKIAEDKRTRQQSQKPKEDQK